jgi:flagellar basal body-associated protein FliL
VKRLIVIVLILLVVAGGGAGGLVMLGVVRNPFQQATTSAAEKAAAEADAKAKESAFNAPLEALPMVRMADMIVPVIVDGGVQRRIYVNLRLVTRPDARDRVLAGLSKYENALLHDLVPYFQDYFRRNDKIDLPAVKKKLRAHAQTVFGEAVTDVLLVNLFESGISSGGRGAFGTPE